MSELLNQIQNITHEAETDIEHAESIAEIIGLVSVALCLACVLYQICRILQCVKWCICFEWNPYRRVV